MHLVGECSRPINPQSLNIWHYHILTKRTFEEYVENTGKYGFEQNVIEWKRNGNTICSFRSENLDPPYKVWLILTPRWAGGGFSWNEIPTETPSISGGGRGLGAGSGSGSTSLTKSFFVFLHWAGGSLSYRQILISNQNRVNSSNWNFWHLHIFSWGQGRPLLNNLFTLRRILWRYIQYVQVKITWNPPKKLCLFS